MISKEDYVLQKVLLTLNSNFDPKSLNSLIDQWAFDYDMDSEYRPEVLSQKEDKVIFVNRATYEQISEILGYEPENLKTSNVIEDNKAIVMDKDKLNKFYISDSR